MNIKLETKKQGLLTLPVTFLYLICSIIAALLAFVSLSLCPFQQWLNPQEPTVYFGVLEEWITLTL
jgi:hypothetical protein